MVHTTRHYLQSVLPWDSSRPILLFDIVIETSDTPPHGLHIYRDRRHTPCTLRPHFACRYDLIKYFDLLRANLYLPKRVLGGYDLL